MTGKENSDIAMIQDGREDLKVVFGKPYSFEGNEYTELDLSGLESLSTGQLYEINKKFATQHFTTPVPELQPAYCCMAAAKVCRLPHEFFERLPAKEGLKVRNAVQRFFFAEEPTE